MRQMSPVCHRLYGSVCRRLCDDGCHGMIVLDHAVLFDCRKNSEDAESPKTPMTWHTTLTLSCDKALAKPVADRRSLPWPFLRSCLPLRRELCFQVELQSLHFGIFETVVADFKIAFAVNAAQFQHLVFILESDIFQLQLSLLKQHECECIASPFVNRTGFFAELFKVSEGGFGVESYRFRIGGCGDIDHPVTEMSLGRPNPTFRGKIESHESPLSLDKHGMTHRSRCQRFAGRRAGLSQRFEMIVHTFGLLSVDWFSRKIDGIDFVEVMAESAGRNGCRGRPRSDCGGVVLDRRLLPQDECLGTKEREEKCEESAKNEFLFSVCFFPRFSTLFPVF